MLTLEQTAQKLEETLTQLDILAADIIGQADVWKTSPYLMRKSDGSPALAEIIIARAQTLAAYTAIQVDIRVQERARQEQEKAEIYHRRLSQGIV
jgi:hypothetical protein